MRLLTTSLLAIIAAVSIAACSGGSSSSSSSDQTASSSADQSMGAASAAPESAAPAAAAPAGGGIPNYPGANVEASGSSSGMGAASSAEGKVETTSDSFDKVYAWYQKNLPAGSEKAHTTSPIQSAVFTEGQAGKDQQSVTITVQGSKTMITIAHVKSM